MMFIGGMMVAQSIEYCNLHKRIALSVLTIVGGNPRWSVSRLIVRVDDFISNIPKQLITNIGKMLAGKVFGVGNAEKKRGNSNLSF